MQMSNDAYTERMRPEGENLYGASVDGIKEGGLWRFGVTTTTITIMIMSIIMT